MIVALASAPTGNLDDAFDALSNELPNELTPILNWSEDNYIGRPGRDNRRSRPAPFPPKIWSMYQRTISGIDRTNNPADATHRRLKRELDVVYLSIWKFTDGLHRVQKERDVTYERYVCGEPGPVKRRESILVDQRLLTTANDTTTETSQNVCVESHIPSSWNKQQTSWCARFFDNMKESFSGG